MGTFPNPWDKTIVGKYLSNLNSGASQLWNLQNTKVLAEDNTKPNFKMKGSSEWLCKRRASRRKSGIRQNV